jgi:hypothetical protein
VHVQTCAVFMDDLHSLLLHHAAGAKPSSPNSTKRARELTFTAAIQGARRASGQTSQRAASTKRKNRPLCQQRGTLSLSGSSIRMRFAHRNFFSEFLYQELDLLGCFSNFDFVTELSDSAREPFGGSILVDSGKIKRSEVAVRYLIPLYVVSACKDRGRHCQDGLFRSAAGSQP